MKKQIILLFTGILALSFSVQAITYQNPPRKYKKIQKYLNQATRDKLVGVVIYISTPKRGEWIGTSGYANLETKQPAQSDNIFAIASIGKMYNAVALLKLAEEKKMNLDNKIENYLPVEIAENVANARQVTIRQLLNHTSGFVNYENDPELVRLYISGQLKLDTLSRLDVLRRCVFGKPSLFSPGTKYNYSSTNYLLLAMIVDKVVPEGHSDYLRKLIGQQGSVNTYYRQTPPEKNVGYYGDLNQDGKVENITVQTLETTNWFTGDDGVYAPVTEAAHFLQDLMKGEILNQQSLREMMTWNNEKKPDYGLGLMADKSFPYNLLIGHSGRGIGVTTDLYYFPKQDITVAIFCNTGYRIGSRELKKAYLKMRTKIVKKLFLF